MGLKGEKEIEYINKSVGKYNGKSSVPKNNVYSQQYMAKQKEMYAKHDHKTEMEGKQADANLDLALTEMSSYVPMNWINGEMKALETGDKTYATEGLNKDLMNLAYANMASTGPQGIALAMVTKEGVTAYSIAKQSSSLDDFWNKMDENGPTGYKVGQYVGNKFDQMWDAVLGPLVK